MNPTTEQVRRDRDLRQREIVPPERLAGYQALVIGVGAIGRQVALQLAAVGVPRLLLFDDDAVQVENLAPQGYWAEDLDKPKVVATADLCRRTNPEVQVVAIPERCKRSTGRRLPADLPLVVFLCVDSIRTRRLLWEALHRQAVFLVDGRMSAEVVRVLAVASPASDSYYATTLFQPEQSYAGSCTAKATIYTANIAAGLMLGQFTRWLRQLPVDADVCFNLLAMELTANAPGPSETPVRSPRRAADDGLPARRLATGARGKWAAARLGTGGRVVGPAVVLRRGRKGLQPGCLARRVIFPS